MILRVLGMTGVAGILLTAAASAQTITGTATLAGTVRGDQDARLRAVAHVALPALRRETATNARGEFRLDSLPAGTYQIVVRSIGYAPRQDTVTLVAGRTTTRTILLAPQVTRLDSVTVQGEERRYLSPALRGFEERRRQGFGRFIAEDELRKRDDQRFTNVVTSRIPGLRTANEGGRTILVSTRSSSTSSGLAFAQSIGDRGRMGKCMVTVFVDGVPLVETLNAGGAPRLDFDRLNTRDFAAVEFYPGGATVPAQFNSTRNGCGTLLLWSRER